MTMVHSSSVSTAHGAVKLGEWLEDEVIARVKNWPMLEVKIFCGKAYVIGKLGNMVELWVSPGCTIEVHA